MASEIKNKKDILFGRISSRIKGVWIYLLPIPIGFFLWVSFTKISPANAFPFYALIVVVLFFILLCYEGYKLTPDQALYEQPLFWVAALLPLYTGLYLGSFIWSFSWQLTGSAFNSFIEGSKLPLGVMALGIPFGVMVGSFHRTLQTAEQIKQAESANKFKNYVEHKREFLDGAKKHRLLGKDEMLALDVYNYFFPDAKNGGFSIKDVAVVHAVARCFESYRVINVLSDYKSGQLLNDHEYMEKRRQDLLDGCINMSRFFESVGIPSAFIGKPEACAEHIDATSSRDARRALEVMGNEELVIKSFDDFKDLLVFVKQYCLDSGFRLAEIYLEKPLHLTSKNGVAGKILALMTSSFIRLNARLASEAFSYMVNEESLTEHDKLIFCNNRAWDVYDEILDTLEIQRAEFK